MSDQSETQDLPVLPLKLNVLFPGASMSIGLAGKTALAGLEAAATRNPALILCATQRDASLDDPGHTDFHRTGCVAHVLLLQVLDPEHRLVILMGLQRGRVLSVTPVGEHLRATVGKLVEEPMQGSQVEGLLELIKVAAWRLVELLGARGASLQSVLRMVMEPARLVDMILSSLELSVDDAQPLLDEEDFAERCRLALTTLEHRIAVMEVADRIRSETGASMDKAAKEHILREQMRAIRRELGEGEDESHDLVDIKRRLEEARVPGSIQKDVSRELKRLSSIHPASPEYMVARTYLEWIASLPWEAGTDDDLDVERARKVLEEDHFGLQKVNKRILEFIAVRKLKPDHKGPILCFVGPPGVGKTSLGRSIARALGRKFHRISLGGVRDEAEIRGHRRTYVGALPGRVIQALRRVGSRNPVIVLDEIDKIGADFRGDPASALLEVLDPEQNHSFSDHYLDLPFDLSNVLFITTANVTDTIPPALLDRMEMIHIPGYALEDKVSIARRHLLPRQIEQNGIDSGVLEVTDEALQSIARDYVREAGVRCLEREIAAVCREVACRVASGEEGQSHSIEVHPLNVREFLGPQRFFPEVQRRTGAPGVSIGLAWTPSGGEILFIESLKMPGKGGLVLTGQLGQVMEESARAAFSFLRSGSSVLGIPESSFQEFDLHIHVPKGAIKKDGPSAGVAIYASLCSLYTGTPLATDVAMSGEITLKGLVLPVGGVKEKVIAAHLAGIRRIILPGENEGDVEEVPAHIRKDLQFQFIHDLDQLPGLVGALHGPKRLDLTKTRRLSAVP